MRNSTQDFSIDFIGIGAPKCATTWVSQCLHEHPDVFFAPPPSEGQKVDTGNELNFFNKRYPFFSKLRDEVDKEFRYKKGLGWYKKQFKEAKPSQLKGEFSPDYFFDPDAAELIHKHFSDVKLLLILRNPAERMYSHYVHGKEKADMPPFKRVVEEYPEFKQEGYYYKHLKRYLKYFSRDQIFIGLFPDIKDSPEEFIKNIYDFLGVDNSFTPPSVKKKINKTGPRSSKLRRGYIRFKRGFMNNSVKNWAVKYLKKLGISRKIYDITFKPTENLVYYLSNKKKSYSSLDKGIRRELNQEFSESTSEIEDLLDRDLSEWKK